MAESGGPVLIEHVDGELFHGITYGDWPVCQSLFEDCEDQKVNYDDWPVFEPERDEKVVIVTDWDDTVFPTHFVLARMKQLYKTRGISEEQEMLECIKTEDKQGIFLAVERQMANFFQNAEALGTVIIITNALEGWVERSSKTLVPGVWEQYVSRYKIVSARSKYEDKTRDKFFPSTMQQLYWKQEAFRNDVPRCAELFAMGDAPHDMEAAECALQCQKKTIVKTLDLEIDGEHYGPNIHFGKQLERLSREGELQKLMARGGNIVLC